MKINVNALLDRSGSMQTGRDDHEGGLKSFINDQKKQEGETVFSFAQFDGDNPFELIFNNANIQDIDVEQVKLTPRGSTPLCDAFGKMIAHIEQCELKNKSDQVMLIVITDGGENASREWTKTAVKNSVEKHKDDWQILFLGANIDSFADAHIYGLNSNQAININNAMPQSVRSSYSMMGRKMHSLRSAVSGGYSKAEILNACALDNADYMEQTEYSVDNSKGMTQVDVDAENKS